MTPRQLLRERLGIMDEPAGPNSPNVTDEEILNVFRRELEIEDGKEELTTSEITEELPIVHRQTHNRLKDLKKENRLEKRRAGQTDMWSLAAGETETVVNPELGPIIKKSGQARRRAKEIKRRGFLFCGGGFILLIIGMTFLISDVPQLDFGAAVFLAFGYSSGAVGALIVMAGIVLRLAGIYTPHLAERYLLD